MRDDPVFGGGGFEYLLVVSLPQSKTSARRKEPASSGRKHRPDFLQVLPDNIASRVFEDRSPTQRQDNFKWIPQTNNHFEFRQQTGPERQSQAAPRILPAPMLVSAEFFHQQLRSLP